MRAYCVPPVRGLSPDALLERQGGKPDIRPRGAADLTERAHDPRDAYDGDRQFVAVAASGPASSRCSRARGTGAAPPSWSR